MPSAEHQSLIRLLTEGPGVLRSVLALVGIDVPDSVELRPGPDAVREGGPSDFFVDGVMALYGSETEARRACALEVQLGEDPSKHFTWPMYVTVTRNRLRCPVDLVVVTDSVHVARWASRPITIGSGMTLHPVVIGPEQIPEHVSMEEAREVPAIAVLSAVGHGRGPGAKRIGRTAFEAIRPMLGRDERAILYLDVLCAYLDREVLEEILEEEMMQLQQPISPIFKEHWANGMTKGMACMLTRLLERRGLAISEVERARMDACTEPERLQLWFDRAFTASSVAEVLDAQA